MTIVIQGLPLGGGITINNAHIIDNEIDNAVNRYLDNDDLENEIKRFQTALEQTKNELEFLKKSLSKHKSHELINFITLSIAMLNDDQISIIPITLIRELNCNSEWAIKLQADSITEQFNEMDDEYIQERKYDVINVLEKVYRNLDGNKLDLNANRKFKNKILVCHNMTPADLADLKKLNFSGFVIENSSTTSHASIVGRNLEIPSIVGANSARQIINDDDLIILDGTQGVLIINPDKLILAEYKQRLKQWRDEKRKLKYIINQPCVTLDNEKIDLFVNIDQVNQLSELNKNNVAGVGLFRSEFLYLYNNDNDCSEEEQFKNYYKITQLFNKLPILIRTADFSSDKTPIWYENRQNNNPALGLTGIRLSLAEESMFRTQLRAILRASHYGDIQIMFPMISSSWELKQVIAHVDYVKQELTDENIKFNAKIKIGAMIEVPSAAIAIKEILKLVDFISIGTNDLLQYLLAVDRNNEHVSYLYNPLHPSVIKLLKYIIDQCNKYKVDVSLCGEIAADINFTRLLLGLGLRKFSVNTGSFLNIKQIILSTSLTTIRPIIKKIQRTENLDKIIELVEQLNQDIVV